MRRKKQKAKKPTTAEEIVASLPEPADLEPLLDAKRGAGSRWTVEDDERQADALLRLRLRGATPGEIRKIAREHFEVGADRADRLLQRAWDRMKSHLDATLPQAKAMLLASYDADLAELHAVKKGDKKNWHAILRLQQMRAELLGANAPQEVKVDVRVQHAMLAVASALTPDQLEGLREKARERRRLAAAQEVLDGSPLAAHPPRLNGTH